MIVAKPVIPNQYWILRQDDQKIGNIEAGPDGFQVKIQGRVENFKTIHTIKKTVPIEFESASRPRSQMPNEKTAYGYPTTGRSYNAIYDVKHQVPLWTKESRSKSWYAAGWFRILQGRRWNSVLCPKLIMLERYQYQGPFHTKEEAETHEPAHQSVR